MQFFNRMKNIKNPLLNRLRKGLLPKVFCFIPLKWKGFLEIPQHLPANKVDMQVVYRLSAVDALVDNHTIAVL